MGLFRWLFGQKETAEPDPAAANLPPLDFSGFETKQPEKPTVWNRRCVHWRTSENGNPMAIVGNLRMTVFSYGDDGWKYCLAKNDVEDDDPYFSDVYNSQDAAMYEAVAHLQGLPSRFKTDREARAERRAEEGELRAQERAENLPTWLEGEKDNLGKIEASVARAINSEKTTLKRLQNLQKRIETRQRALKGFLGIVLETGQLAKHQESTHVIETMMNRYQRLSGEVSQRKSSVHE